MRRLTLSVVAVAIVIIAGYLLLWTHDRSQSQARSYDVEKLSQLPGYRLVKQQEPQLWQELVAHFSKSLAQGESFAQAVGNIRSELTELVNLRIVKADDDAVINYITVTVAEMEALNTVSAESCFNYLYPQVSGGVNLGRELPVALNLREQRALDRLFATSQGADKPLNTPLARQTLTKIIAELYPQWGDQLKQLNQPEDLATDRQKLCAMSIDLYRTILKQPTPVAANIIRQIVAG